MQRTSWTWLSIPLVTVALAAQEPVRVTQLVPLAGFRAPQEQLGRAFGGSLLPGESTGNTPLVTGEAGPAVAGWPVRELLERRYRRAVEEGRLELCGDGDLLLLRGEPAMVATCRREIDALLAAVARPVEVVAMLLPPSPGAEVPGSVLTAAEVAGLRQRQPPSWTAQGRVRAGSGLALGRERWTPYVRDIDVEVATGSAIGDPKVDWAMSGVRVVAAAHPLPMGDDLLLLGWFAVGEPVAMREAKTGVDDQPTVDLPEWNSALGTFAARIPDGGAAAITVRAGHGLAPACTVLVSARALAPAVGAVAEDLWVLPISALTTEAHLGRVRLGPSVMLPGQDAPVFLEQERPEADFGRVPPELLVQLLGDDADAVSTEAGFVLVQAAPPVGAAIVERLRRLGDEMLRNAVQRWELRPDVAGEAAPLLALTQPTLLGRESWAFVGRERARVGDFEVEISGGSAAANNPVIQVGRSGVWSRARLRPSPGGVTCDALWSALAQGEPRERPLRGTPPGLLGLATTDVVAFPWDAPIGAGREHDLGDGPPMEIEGRRLATRLFVRVDVP